MYLMENYARLPVSFERGEGVYLYDGEGRRYLDFVSGIGVVSLGHSHPDLVEVIRRQAGEVLHTSNLFINPWQEELAEKLVREFGEPARVFFCNSGTEANEAALKLVRRYWRDRGKEKYRVLAFRKSFHGRTYGSLSATGQEKLWEGFEPLLKGFDFADLNDMDSVREAVGEETGAVLVEIIQGEGGVNECSKEFLEGLSALCRDRGILLVVDEVQTGAGRTGRFFCYQHYGIRPDIVTLAKGLGGGIPIGAVIAREEVAAAFVPGTHGSTFGGNALACRVASLVVDMHRRKRSQVPATPCGSERTRGQGCAHSQRGHLRRTTLFLPLFLASYMAASALLIVSSRDSLKGAIPMLTVTFKSGCFSKCRDSTAFLILWAISRALRSFIRCRITTISSPPNLITLS